METYKKKQTQKRLFTTISKGFVTPVKSLTVNRILQNLPNNHFKL